MHIICFLAYCSSLLLVPRPPGLSTLPPKSYYFSNVKLTFVQIIKPKPNWFARIDSKESQMEGLEMGTTGILSMKPSANIYLMHTICQAFGIEALSLWFEQGKWGLRFILKIDVFILVTFLVMKRIPNTHNLKRTFTLVHCYHPCCQGRNSWQKSLHRGLVLLSWWPGGRELREEFGRETHPSRSLPQWSGFFWQGHTSKSTLSLWTH